MVGWREELYVRATALEELEGICEFGCARRRLKTWRGSEDRRDTRWRPCGMGKGLWCECARGQDARSRRKVGRGKKVGVVTHRWQA